MDSGKESTGYPDRYGVSEIFKEVSSCASCIRFLVNAS